MLGKLRGRIGRVVVREDTDDSDVGSSLLRHSTYFVFYSNVT